MSKLILAKAHTAYREASVPKKADLLYDVDLDAMFVGDGVTPGGILVGAGGGTGEVTGGFGITVVGDVVSLTRFEAIDSLVSGGTVRAGYAYKLNATSISGTTIYAEYFERGTYSREPAHIQIMVNGTGFLHLGQKTTPGSETAPFVLEGKLEPDAMNNVTVRFHDGVAVMTVEDHIGGYVVIDGGTTGAGTLAYALTATGDDASPYITFSSELNGTPINLAGTTVTTERHVVGNGYDETILGGTVSVDDSTGSLSLANLALQDVVVASGTMILGDAYIPSGSTVAVSGGGGLAVEKVTGAGSNSVIDFGGTNYAMPQNALASYNDVTVSGGVSLNNGGVANGGNFTVVNATSCTFSGNSCASAYYGGAFIIESAAFASCTFSGNYGGYGGAFSTLKNQRTNLEMSGCVVSGNSARYSGGGIYIQNLQNTVQITDSIISGNVTGTETKFSNNDISLNSGTLQLTGSNVIGVLDGTSGTLTLTSGAILDLTGNTNPTPINPGGGITFEAGGATVLYSSGAVSSSYMMDNVTLPAGAKLTNTASVNLSGTNVSVDLGTSASVSGCTFSGGSAANGGGAFNVISANIHLNNVELAGNNAGFGGAIALATNNANAELISCYIHDNSSTTGTLYNAGNGEYVLSGTTIGANQRIAIMASSGKTTFSGSNAMLAILDGGAVTLTSGAILDLTGNTNSTPIAPNGGVIVDGGCTVINSAGVSVSIAGGTYTKINNDGTTE